MKRCASGFRSYVAAQPINPLTFNPKTCSENWFTLRRILMVVFVAILVSMLSVDILGYYFLPPQYSEALPGYRFGDAYLTMGYYPKGYFRRDAQLGFDIEANARATTTHVDGMAYSIFSNSVGCFDERDVADFQSNNWVYFGGNSFMWGFAPYKKNLRLNSRG